MPEKYLYLPLEIVVREHDGKATLAHVACQDGWTVLLGPKLFLYALKDQLPEGVFLIKSATPHELSQIRSLKEAGHKVFSLDEEGVVTYKEFLGDNIRFGRESISEIDQIFFWGTEQQKVFNDTFPDCVSLGCVSGSPRLEFWRDHAARVYQEQAKAITDEFGKFVFFPTSFGIANNILGKTQGLELTQKLYTGASSKMESFIVQQNEQNTVVFKEYLDFLPSVLERFEDTNFVVRPHPSEAHDIWKDLSARYANLHLRYEGAVTPWILAAHAVMHFKSTTSIEAHLMGRMVMTYMPSLPEYMKKFVLEQPLSVSRVAYSRAEFVSLIEEVLETSKERPAGQLNAVLEKWISVEDGKSSARRILAKMNEKLPEVTRNLEKAQTGEAGGMLSVLDRCVLLLEQWNILPGRLKARAAGLSYGQHKYAGLDLQHTKKVLEVLNKQAGLNGNDVSVREFVKDVFLLKS